MSTPETLTLQQVFNKMYLGLTKQGAAGMEDGECRYRAKQKDGSTRSCGVGQLILDGAYSAEGETGVGDMRSDSASMCQSTVALREMLRNSGIDTDDSKVFDLLIEAQCAHDNIGNYEDGINFNTSLIREFGRIAALFNLEVPEIPA